MSTSSVLERPPALSTSVLQLARAEARRFARHPLFVAGLLLSLGILARVTWSQEPDTLVFTVVPAFFIGVFGFVVAHRLTTALRRSAELLDVAPTSDRHRSAALCLACLVPCAAGLLCTVEIVVLAALRPPLPVPPDASVIWFGHAAWWPVLAAVVAMGPVACLGGPLLGVTVGTWAPFRGSALVGAVLLVVPVAAATSLPSPWRALPPYSPLVDEHVAAGKIVSSTWVPHLSPVYDLVYVVALCALAVVATLLHAPHGRRPLVWAGAALAVLAAAALAATVG